jgi:hypothetical protein
MTSKISGNGEFESEDDSPRFTKANQWICWANPNRRLQ